MDDMIAWMQEGGQVRLFLNYLYRSKKTNQSQTRKYVCEINNNKETKNMWW